MIADKQTEELQQREEIFNKIKELPTPVEKVKAVAINFILDEKKKLDLELEKEMKALTLKYDKLSQPLYEQTSEIISGKRAVKSEEIEQVKEVLSEEEQKDLEAHQSNTTPISEYWLKAIKNSEMVAPEIKEKDEEILKHLTNIVYIPDESDSLKFELVFTFSENEFFTNTTLTKSFVMRDDDEPSSGKGTEIEWKEGKDVTVKLVKKTQKNKKSGAKRVVSKEVPDESFFNFFKDHEDDGEEPQEDDDEEEQLEAELLSIDFDIARGLIDEVIPYSLEYFLGVKTPEEGYDDYGMDDEEDLDDEDEEDLPKKSKKKAHKKSSDSTKSGGDKKDGEKPECKQQ